MTDRELLERAAKAAGIAGEWCEFHGMDVGQDAYGIGNPRVHRWGDKLWNPLVDDGDALRLAVDLRLMPLFGVDTVHIMCEGVIVVPDGESLSPEPYAATRRAIVRVAAAMVDRPASVPPTPCP